MQYFNGVMRLAGWALVVMAAGDVQGAETDRQPYERYNRGVALIETGAYVEAAALFDALGAMPAATAEQQALRDQAYMAAGYAWLERGDAANAQVRFERVRLAGPASSPALLGLGWAHAVSGRYHEALVPWLELVQRDTRDTAWLNALIAVPYAFEKLRAYKQAAVHYERALALYRREYERLAAGSTQLSEPRVIERQRSRLTRYITDAQLALARFHDKTAHVAPEMPR